jgi:DNA-binding MarR family transcriptional regulator
MSDMTTSHARISAELMDGLAQTSFAVIALLTRMAAENDLSLTQLRALAIVRDRALTMAELADHLGLERSSVSGLIERAHRRGLVRRDPSPHDARAVHVTLSDEGQRLATRLTGEFARLIAPMTGDLSTAEQARLAALLRKLLA